MLQSLDPLTDARRLTDILRTKSERSAPYEQSGTVAEREATLQLVLDGCVMRQRFLSDGRVHTVAVYFPDDVINLGRYAHSSGEETDYLLALEGTVIGSIPYYAVAADERNNINSLMSRELRIAQEHLISLGQRSAIEAVAHFFCETMLRCAKSSPNEDVNRCSFGMTQAALSTVMGLSVVHINRTLQALRRKKLAEVLDHQLVIYDYKGLAALADFDGRYLAPV